MRYVMIVTLLLASAPAHAGNYGENVGVGSPGWSGGGNISPGNGGQAAQVAAENRSWSNTIQGWFHGWFGSRPTTPDYVQDTADRGGVASGFGMRAEPGPGGY